MNAFHDQNEVIFTWCVRNFSFCSQEKCKYICSPALFTKSFYNATWRLFLYPKGSAESNVGYIACKVALSWPDHAPDSLSFGVDLGIVSGSGLRKLSATTERCQFWRDSVLKYSNFASREKIFNERDVFLPNDTLTIQCHVWGRTSSNSLSIRYFAQTLIDVDKCVFRWDMKNFVTWRTNQTVRIPVPLTLKFEVLVYMATTDDSDETIVVDVCQMEPQASPQLLICTLSLLDAKGNVCRSQTREHLFRPNVQDAIWTFPSFLKKSGVLKDRPRYLKDSALSLQCEFSVSSGQQTSFPIEVCEPSRKTVSSAAIKDTLKDDLRRMYEEKKFTDVVLKTDEELFTAHKALLSVRSPVFKAMFEQDMAENQTGTVDISDLDPRTLNSLLVFMYSGILEDWECESVSNLLVAADKYQILELREKCALVLKMTLSVETVCQVYVLADFQEYKDLKTAALDFICRNSQVVLHSNEWLSFIEKNRRLSCEILCKLSTDMGQSR